MLKGNGNLFLGVSYEMYVGKEDGKVDHRVEGHQPENIKVLKDLTKQNATISMKMDTIKEQKTLTDKF